MMADASKNDRVDALLQTHDEAIKAGELQKASAALREASQIQPDNGEVKKRWLALSKSDITNDLFGPVQDYLISGTDDDGQKVLQALRQKQLRPEDAAIAYDVLIRSKSKAPLLDEITSTFLDRHIETRKIFVTELSNNTTNTFGLVYDRGDETFRAATAIVLDDSIWPNKETQRAVQRDFFRLCVATLMGAGIERPERAIRAVARQLAVSPANVTDLIDEDVFDLILSNLDIRLHNTIRSQAMLSASKMLETTKEKGEALFSDFVTSRVAKQTNDDLIVAFSAAASVFPIIPVVSATLFLPEGFVQQLVPHLEKNSAAAAAGKRKSLTLEQAALELLSAACVDKACRAAVDKYCSQWLRDLSVERESTHKALAALILAKTNPESSVDDVTSKLSDLVIQGGGDRGQHAIEGLAYTSLQPKVKEAIAGNIELMRSLMVALQQQPASTAFGCLTVLSNLTTYKPPMSDEQRKMSQLKAYANSSRPMPDDPLENDKHVTARCKKVLDHDVVPALVACCKQSTSPTNIALVVKVLLSLAKEQKHRPKMAQQGAIKLLLQIRDRMSKTDKSTNEASLIERNAAHGLARLLISANPAHVFTSALPVSSAVSAIAPLLSPSQDTSEQQQRDLLPTFEALLALTNLASMDDTTPRDLLIRTSFDKIEELLFSATTLIQRAAVELVCNLMASPQGVAKFADGSADAKRRMQILLALADVQDLATRRAAGGALAMLTEWDAAVGAVLAAKEGKGVRVLLGMCEDESEEIRHRGLVCVSNVANAPGEGGKRGVALVKEAGGVDIVGAAMKKTKSQEVLTLGVDILKKLMV